jgi:glycosyltransferase involved in cell wall biosynthesis
VFNAAPWLGDCLDALQRQEAPAGGFEVIVVDNGSTDGSLAVARQHPAARLLSETRRGAYAARNRGISAARGELIAFTDADCIPRRDWLSRLQQGLAAAPEAMVVMGRDIPTGPSRAIRLLGLYDHFKEIFVLSSEDPAVYYGHTNCMMTRRKLFDEVGFFDQRPRGADVIFVQRVLERYGTRAVQYQPDAVVSHMEVRSGPVYFRKAFIYGRSARSYRQVVPARPLRNSERLLIFRRVVRDCGLPLPERLYLLLLLAIGVAAYSLGWLAPPRAPAAPKPLPSHPGETE